MIRRLRKYESNSPTRFSRYLGSMVGGVVVDAMGAPVEFMQLAQIRNTYGEEGIRDYDKAYGGIGAITDDTQMTIFTAEGLLRAWTRGTLKGICRELKALPQVFIYCFLEPTILSALTFC